MGQPEYEPEGCIAAILVILLLLLFGPMRIARFLEMIFGGSH